MIKNKFSFTIIFSLTLFLTLICDLKAQDDVWHEILKEDNLTVFTRKIKDSSVKEVKIVGTMKANLDAIKMVLTDVEKYPEWIYKCVKSKRFNIVDKANYHYYIETDFPFPFDSRDVVIKTKNWTDKKGIWYTLSVADTDALPEKDNIVRLSRYTSKWVIKRIDAVTVEYEYYFHAEPAGKVPIWVINLGAEKGPMRTIVTLESRCRKIMNLN